MVDYSNWTTGIWKKMSYDTSSPSTVLQGIFGGKHSIVQYNSVSTTIIFCLCRNIIRINNMDQEDNQFFDDVEFLSLPVVVKTGEVEVVA